MSAHELEPGSTADAGTGKFLHPDWTAGGEARACVPFRGYATLWFNTGTLCNLACHNCYIDSSPKNDRLLYLTRPEVERFLNEAADLPDRPMEIGFTGGEPFMNPDMAGILQDSLEFGFRVLVLTNAMRPMQRSKSPLLDLKRRFGKQLAIRVSLDHFEPSGHEQLRGPKSWKPTIDGIKWLSREQFNLSIAGRTVWGKGEQDMRRGYAELFASLDVPVDAHDPASLVLFPEMDESCDVPEISEACWGKLGKSPSDVMCASSRMVVRRKGSPSATVVACTLLPYAEAFEIALTLKEARRSIRLNHKHCARFCVLGGASCSSPRSGEHGAND